MVTIRRPSWSTDGRTAVMRTSAGSVVSKRLNSSVHENVRRSISSFASCARGRDRREPRLDRRCARGAPPSARRSRARALAPRRPRAAERRAAAASSATSARDVEHACTRARRPRRQPSASVHRALVVERPRREVGSQHHARSLRAAGGRRAAPACRAAPALAAIRSVSAIAGRGSTISTRVPSRSSS